jgi:hypothetical protein
MLAGDTPRYVPTHEVGTGGRDQQGFLFSREFAGRARTQLFAQCLFQVAHHEAALGPVYGRPAHADADRDVLVAGARVGSQRSLELARRMLPPLRSAVSSPRSAWLSSTR